MPSGKLNRELVELVQEFGNDQIHRMLWQSRSRLASDENKTTFKMGKAASMRERRISNAG